MLVTICCIVFLIITSPIWIPMAFVRLPQWRLGAVAFVIVCFLAVALLFIYLVTNAVEAAPLAVDVISQLPI
jgi:hypothetical protein